MSKKIMSKQDVIALFANQVNGVHRHNSEAFYKLEAKEKIFHMGTANTILDFGCGSADLLVYYAQHFEKLLGIDISENMLERARSRLEHFGAENVIVQQGDDLTVWEQLKGRRFDVITSAAVMQFFTINQIRAFLHNAIEFLEPYGRVIIFDIVDPRIYWLCKYGLFSEQQMGLTQVIKTVAHASKTLMYEVAKILRLRPRADLMGYTHHPSLIEEIAAIESYEVTFVRSMYYEYRYHALLTRGHHLSKRKTMSRPQCQS